ncbi:MAG: spondin domain-containing protein [Flavobacteriaceae bacterium]
MLKQNVHPLFLGLLTLALFISCDSDDNDGMTDPNTKISTAEFTVTLENVIEAKSYFDTGKTGLIMPGDSESITFNAGKGHLLSFATMYVQSNDLFYAPLENGIPLYDEDGAPLSGDITSSIYLWDAGTEVNEEPGVGENQPPRQAAANTGMNENGMVALIGDIADGYTYPTVSEAIKVSLAHDGGTAFTLTIENLTNALALGSPFAPGVWVLHSMDQVPLFTKGETASDGLENIAEDGNNEISYNELSPISGFVSPFAPGAYSIGNNTIFVEGAEASAGLEALAEDGDSSSFTTSFNTPVGSSAAGVLLPGASYSFTFTAEEGDNLSFATMLVQSNDWFIGGDAIELFNASVPLSGDISSMLKLYDAGTEVDEYAGAGNYQAPRQSAANTGEAENGNIAEETEIGDHVPTISNLIKVTISSK